MSTMCAAPAPVRLRRGFSLVELLMVVALLALIAAIAAPRYASALANYRARCAAQRIAHDLMLARADARQRSAPRTVRFDLTTHQLVIEPMAPLPGDSRGDSAYTTRLTEPPYEARFVRVDFDGDTKVTFDGFGTPDSGGTVTITVGSAHARVLLDGHSGKVSVP